MRYYKIVISGGSGQPVTYTSHPNGTNQPPDPGALNVELDIYQSVFHLPGPNNYIRIWGIALQTIAQASLLNGRSISVYGGMGKGLPLANPQQAGLLAQGTVYQAFGNWVGTVQTLDINMIPAQSTAQATNIAASSPNLPTLPANISLNWQANQPLGTALSTALQTAYPGYKVNVSINSKLVTSYANPHYCGSLTELAQWLLPVTTDIVGGSYSGVMLAVRGNTISAFDSVTGAPTGAAVKQIAFNDLIGQTTWNAPQQVMVPCVMRGDLSVGDQIKLPPGQVTTTAQSYSQFRQASAIQGQFMIQKIRHVGAFRQPQGAAWGTDIFAVATGSAT